MSQEGPLVLQAFTKSARKMVHSNSKLDQRFIRMYKVRQKLYDKVLIDNKPKPNIAISVKRLESKQTEKDYDDFLKDYDEVSVGAPSSRKTIYGLNKSGKS